MNWQDALTIIIPLAALMGWIYSRIDKKFDIMDKRFDSLDSDIKDLSKDIQSLNSRISRIEGQLNVPYHWEPKVKE